MDFLVDSSVQFFSFELFELYFNWLIIGTWLTTSQMTYAATHFDLWP